MNRRKGIDGLDGLDKSLRVLFYWDWGILGEC